MFPMYNECVCYWWVVHNGIWFTLINIRSVKTTQQRQREIYRGDNNHHYTFDWALCWLISGICAWLSLFIIIISFRIFPLLAFEHIWRIELTITSFFRLTLSHKLVLLFIGKTANYYSHIEHLAHKLQSRPWCWHFDFKCLFYVLFLS